MTEQSKVLALCVPGCPDRRKTAELVRSALGEGTDLGAMEVEILPGRRDTLLLVHPAAGLYIDRRAAKVLAEWLGT